MPFKSTCTKISNEPLQFLKICLEKNLEWAYNCGNINPIMYEYLEGLSLMGQHIDSYQGAFPEREYSIYSSNHRPIGYGSEEVIYFLADDLGLISSYIIGPTLERAQSPSIPINTFFGLRLVRNVNNTKIFSCFLDYEKGIKNSVPIVDLGILRKRFLPLPSDIFNRTNNYHISARDNIYSRASESNNNLLLQTNKRTFFLPFDELVSKEIGSSGRITVYAEPKNEYFEIKVYKNTHFRKKELTESWKGIVSYDKFDLIELEFLKKEYYSRW